MPVAYDLAIDLINQLGANVKGPDAALARRSLGALMKAVFQMKMVMMAFATELAIAGRMTEEGFELLQSCIGDPVKAKDEYNAWCQGQ